MDDNVKRKPGRPKTNFEDLSTIKLSKTLIKKLEESKRRNNLKSYNEVLKKMFGG